MAVTLWEETDLISLASAESCYHASDFNSHRVWSVRSDPVVIQFNMRVERQNGRNREVMGCFVHFSAGFALGKAADRNTALRKVRHLVFLMHLLLCCKCQLCRMFRFLFWNNTSPDTLFWICTLNCYTLYSQTNLQFFCLSILQAKNRAVHYLYYIERYNNHTSESYAALKICVRPSRTGNVVYTFVCGLREVSLVGIT